MEAIFILAVLLVMLSTMTRLKFGYNLGTVLVDDMMPLSPDQISEPEPDKAIVFAFLGGLIKGIGKIGGKILGAAAPIAKCIPGVGGIIGTAAGILGGALRGEPAPPQEPYLGPVSPAVYDAAAAARLQQANIALGGIPYAGAVTTAGLGSFISRPGPLGIPLSIWLIGAGVAVYMIARR